MPEDIIKNWTKKHMERVKASGWLRKAGVAEHVP
jgi:hypothetical protein